MNPIIIKIGTNILSTEKNKLDLNNLRNIVNQVSFIKNKYHLDICLVSSGSITCGKEVLKSDCDTIPEKQAAASIGQVLLMQEYYNFFIHNNLNIGQLLLSKTNFENTTQRQNIKNTLNSLFKKNIIPIINENDTVSTNEINENFTDNDELSSLLAVLTKAKKLIILTDLDGLFDKNPKLHKEAKLIKSVSVIDEQIMSLIEEKQSTKSKGGMLSKLESAKRCLDSNIEVVISNGRKSNIIVDIFEGNDFDGTTIKS